MCVMSELGKIEKSDREVLESRDCENQAIAVLEDEVGRSRYDR